MKRLFLIILAHFFCLGAFAQVPGYLGKKNLIQVHFMSGVNIDGPTTGNKALNGGYVDRYDYSANPFEFSMVYKYGIRYERVIGRYISVTASYDQFKTGMVNELEILTEDFNGQFTERSDVNMFQHIKAQEMNIGFKFFSKASGSIAPLGVYFGTSIGLGRYETNVIDYQRRIDQFEGEDFILPAYISNYQRLLFGFELGTNYIVKDKFLFSIGINTNLPLIELFNSSVDDTSFLSSTDEISEANTMLQEGKISQRLLYHNMLMFNIGIGYVF